MPSLSDVVTLDSNTMTYLAQVFHPDYDPESDSSGLRDDRIALFRLYLYLDNIPWIVPAIEQEYQQIKEQQRLQSHTHLAYAYLNEAPELPDIPEVEERVKELLVRHPGEQDCRVVAQTEALGANVLLSCDNDLLRHLSSVARISLERPTTYWNQLAVPRGKRPRLEPKLGSAEKTVWWKW